MKFSKLDLLTLLISLFLFSSCKDSSTIGLDVTPASAIRGILNDTVTVSSRTQADIPVTTYPVFSSSGSVTFGLSRYPLGIMTDDVYGTTTSSLALSVGLPSSSAYSFGTNAVIDSAVLVIPFSAPGTANGNQQIYGDSTAVYSLSVNQLNEDLSLKSPWLSTQKYTFGAQLGTFSATVKPTTQVRIINVISGAIDTAQNVPAQLRIKLNSSLIQSKIMSLDSATLSTNARFNTAFKGLNVAATSVTKKGGMLMLDFSSGSNANLEIYYKKQNATTATNRDTVVARFPIQRTSITNPIAATIVHNYTGTPVATQLANPKDYEVTYLQGMNGLKNKISFPYLLGLKAKIGSDIVISKAELVVDINDPADSIPFKIAPRLALYRYDIAEQRVQLPDNNASDPRTGAAGLQASFGGVYDYTKKSYTFTVTSYIQDLIDGKTVDYGTFLAPTAFTEFNVFPYASVATRATIGSGINTNNRKIRLNIYYVKTK